MVFLPVCINASILDVCRWYDIASAVSMYISMVFGVVLAEAEGTGRVFSFAKIW